MYHSGSSSRKVWMRERFFRPAGLRPGEGPHAVPPRSRSAAAAQQQRGSRVTSTKTHSAWLSPTTVRRNYVQVHRLLDRDGTTLVPPTRAQSVPRLPSDPSASADPRKALRASDTPRSPQPSPGGAQWLQCLPRPRPPLSTRCRGKLDSIVVGSVQRSTTATQSAHGGGAESRFVKRRYKLTRRSNRPVRVPGQGRHVHRPPGGCDRV